MHGYARAVQASVVMIYLAMIIVMIASLHALTVYKLQHIYFYIAIAIATSYICV